MIEVGDVVFLTSEPSHRYLVLWISHEDDMMLIKRPDEPDIEAFLETELGMFKKLQFEVGQSYKEKKSGKLSTVKSFKVVAIENEWAVVYYQLPQFSTPAAGLVLMSSIYNYEVV